jgi:hypothetical protein
MPYDATLARAVPLHQIAYRQLKRSLGLTRSWTDDTLMETVTT